MGALALPVALPAVSARSRAGPAPRGVGTAALQRGSVSHGPAALATLRPCELLPVGALSRGSRGTRGGLGAGNETTSGVIQTGCPLLQGSQSAVVPVVAQSSGSRSITVPAGAGSCFHPSPCRKKSLIQAIEKICKSNYLPRALPGAVPPPRSLRSRVSAFPGPAVCRAHTKGC